MTLIEVVALIAVIFAAVLIGSLIIVLSSMMKTLLSLQSTVDALRTEAIPLLGDLRTMVQSTDAELARVEGVLEIAEAASESVHSASRLASRAFANPLIKTASMGSGIASALRWLTPDRWEQRRVLRARKKLRAQRRLAPIDRTGHPVTGQLSRISQPQTARRSSRRRNRALSATGFPKLVGLPRAKDA